MRRRSDGRDEVKRRVVALAEGLTVPGVQLKMNSTMNTIINAKELRASLPDVVAKVRKGARFTVVYRSKPAFQLVPIGAADSATSELSDDSLYRAAPVGRSTDGASSEDHDRSAYDS